MYRHASGAVYRCLVPKLWNETIESHRRDVRDAVMDTVAALVFEHGLRGVTMAQIAERAGIGRATLYKYFSDVDAILHAWHARQVENHLRQLREIHDGAGDPAERLHSALLAYARIVQQSRSHDTELVKFLHPNQQVHDAQRELHDMVAQLIIEAADGGHLRADVVASELASYCVHALNAAATLTTNEALERLVTVTVDGLRSSRRRVGSARK
jgi:AcrR family transcriptional regulator